ncbi:MAG: hypothetical protein AAGC55_06065 [Myxococcota bacterium]
MKQLVLVLSILCLAACGSTTDNTGDPSLNDGSGDDIGGGNGDGTGGGDGTGNGGTTACATPAQLTATPVLSEGAYSDDTALGGDLYVGAYMAMDDSATPDILAVELWQGYGVFAEALQTGTFEITGAETSLAECGACVYMLGDFDPAGGARQFFMAQSGTITIESVPAAAGAQLTGRIENVTISEIAINDETNETSVVPGGCQSTIDQLSFDVTAVAIPDEPAPAPQQ